MSMNSLLTDINNYCKVYLFKLAKNFYNLITKKKKNEKIWVIVDCTCDYLCLRKN